MKESIAAVVVTFNRKDLLIECLNAIRTQSLQPEEIFIIDNLSTDGTPKRLLQEQYINELPEDKPAQNQILKYEINSLNEASNNIKVTYIRKCENDGGAGGFFEGMKRAYESGFEWIWLMDDDGLPEKNQVLRLFEISIKMNLSYSNALVLNVDDKSELAFGISNYTHKNDINEKEIIHGKVNPFNGTFINRTIPEKIGLIKKEMFIWGDEIEYTLRVKKNDFKIGTVISAIHYHPKSKTEFYYVIPFLKLWLIDIKPKNRIKTFFRNKGYIQNTYGSKKGSIYIIFKYSCYYLLRLEFFNFKTFFLSYMEGMRNHF